MHQSVAATRITKSKDVSAVVDPPRPFVDGMLNATIVDVPIKELDCKNVDFQYRTSTWIHDLKESIARDGQREPIDVDDSKPKRIIDGYQRVQAVTELGWVSVKAFVHSGVDEERSHQLAFTKNVVRKNLTPLDRANAVHLAKRRGLKHAAIALAFGMSERQLQRYERLLDVSKPLLELVDAGETSMAHAAVLAKFDGINLVDWIEKTQDKKWSAMELGREIRRARKQPAATSERRYINIKAGVLRMYDSQVRKDAPLPEKKRITIALKEALRFLEG